MVAIKSNESEGVRKAAILLMSLEDGPAAQIMSMLPRRYVERISLEIAQLESVSPSEQEKVVQEFLQTRPSALRPGSGGIDKAKNLVKKAR